MFSQEKKHWEMSKKIVCFGPGPVFKGGLSNYNTSLAKTFDAMDDTEVHIVSWTHQYPSIIPREFKDKVSAKGFLEGTNISVKYLTNYNNPFSWTKTAKYIAGLEPEKVIIQWSIAIQGLPIGSLIKKIKNYSPKTEVIIDLHFVIQKEKSKIDMMFTQRGIKNADTYIVHALKTFEELKVVFPEKNFYLTKSGDRAKDGKTTVIKLFHPIYDLYKPDPDFDVEAFKKENNLRKHVFLFFGFIRKYKGLHHTIEAFAKVAKKRNDVSLLICGESFWNTLDNKSIITKLKKVTFGVAKSIFLGNEDDEGEYKPLDLIEELGISDQTVVFNRFIANEEVHKYFQASNCVVLYYLTATPSGIESLSYNFELPILATEVGHFPETIEDGFNGYLAKANDIDDMAKVMEKYLDHPLPGKNVSEATKGMSWEVYASAIMNSQVRSG
jgi:glycosyltransferase involved in cell wall biosynthesis